MLVPSIDLFFYLTTALLKIDIFRHSKAYSSHSFQPTGIGLVHCEEQTGAHAGIFQHTYKLVIFLQTLKVVHLTPQKNTISKN